MTVLLDNMLFWSFHPRFTHFWNKLNALKNLKKKKKILKSNYCKEYHRNGYMYYVQTSKYAFKCKHLLKDSINLKILTFTLIKLKFYCFNRLT